MEGREYCPDDPVMAQKFEALADQLAEESLRPHQAILISDIVRNEALKDILFKDIIERGIEIRYSNGRSTLKKENKSIANLQKVQDQTRRTMMALGLIAREQNRDANSNDDGDDFEEF